MSDFRSKICLFVRFFGSCSVMSVFIPQKDILSFADGNTAGLSLPVIIRAMLFIIKRSERDRNSRKDERHDDGYRIEAVEQNAEPRKNAEHKHAQGLRKLDRVFRFFFFLSQSTLYGQTHEKKIADGRDISHQISEYHSVVPLMDQKIDGLHEHAEDQRKNGNICGFLEDGLVNLFHQLTLSDAAASHMTAGLRANVA